MMGRKVILRELLDRKVWIWQQPDPKPDLTPRQIEWCKAWIPAFNPKVLP